MNSMEAVRAAIDAVHAHVCNSHCARNADGCCYTKIGLWRAQHQAALAWNAPAHHEEVTAGPGYL